MKKGGIERTEGRKQGGRKARGARKEVKTIYQFMIYLNKNYQA